jgi:Protein of unknown function (DUF3800)
MLTYIDESGDIGVKEGSTPYFRLAAVFFEHPNDLDEYSERISVLRTEQGLPQSFEFHFTEISHPLRMAFFRAVAFTRFSFVVSFFAKGNHGPADLTKDIVRKKTVARLIKHLDNIYNLCERKQIIIFDDCRDPRFEKALKDGFKSPTQPGHSVQRPKIRPGKSHNEPGIQLADMICGAIGNHLDGKSEYYGLVKVREWAIEEAK